MNTGYTLQPLVIWGASGHAKVVADIVREQGVYRIAGFLDNVNPDRRGSEFCGATILGGEEQLADLREQGLNLILPGFGNCQMRLRLTERLENQGFVLPVAVHPRATVAKDVVLGAGTVVAAGAVINPGVTVGRSVIINTSSSVDHECEIGDAAHICPGAHLAGRVIIGQAAQVGIGAAVIEYVQIGAGAVIGAGSAVVDNIPDCAVAFGVPARIKRMANE